jgi:predicted metal-dependent TIM-barrel fold hydrolase
MSSVGLLTIVFYKTLDDYDYERPAAIYIITPRRNHKLAIEKARILESRFKGVEVRILIEHKDKDKIDQLLDLCLEASKTVGPSIW